MSINVIATPVNKSYDIKRYDTGVASMKIADTGGGIGVNLGWVSGYADVIAREIDLAKIKYIKFRLYLSYSQNNPDSSTFRIIDKGDNQILNTLAVTWGYDTPSWNDFIIASANQDAFWAKGGKRTIAIQAPGAASKSLYCNCSSWQFLTDDKWEVR